MTLPSRALRVSAAGRAGSGCAPLPGGCRGRKPRSSSSSGREPCRGGGGGACVVLCVACVRQGMWCVNGACVWRAGWPCQKACACEPRVHAPGDHHRGLATAPGAALRRCTGCGRAGRQGAMQRRSGGRAQPCVPHLRLRLVAQPLCQEGAAHGVREDAGAAPERQPLLHAGPLRAAAAASATAAAGRQLRRLGHQHRAVLAAILQQQAAGGHVGAEGRRVARQLACAGQQRARQAEQRGCRVAQLCMLLLRGQRGAARRGALAALAAALGRVQGEGGEDREAEERVVVRLLRQLRAGGARSSGAG
jgi:hypothetical protein